MPVTPAEWALILGAIGTVVASIVASIKVLAEVATMREENARSRAATRKQLEPIQRELSANGGDTVVDRVARLGRDLGALAATLDDLDRQVGHIDTTVDRALRRHDFDVNLLRGDVDRLRQIARDRHQAERD